MYDLHEVMIHWEIGGKRNVEPANIYTFHLCVGREVAKDFREFLADLVDDESLLEFAKSCGVNVEDVKVRIKTTECHPIGTLGFIRDTDISDMRKKFILNRIPWGNQQDNNQ